MASFAASYETSSTSPCLRVSVVKERVDSPTNQENTNVLVPHLHQLASRPDCRRDRHSGAAGALLPQASAEGSRCRFGAALAEGDSRSAGERAVSEAPPKPAA